MADHQPPLIRVAAERVVRILLPIHDGVRVEVIQVIDPRYVTDLRLFKPKAGAC